MQAGCRHQPDSHAGAPYSLNTGRTLELFAPFGNNTKSHHQQSVEEQCSVNAGD
jgi:hypothetical protein